MDPDSSSRLPPRLVVTVTDGRGRFLRDGGLARWLVATAPPVAAGEIAIALVSDARMHAMNRQFRGGDYATDVLSFPGEQDPPVPKGARRGRRWGQRRLGDIVIATGVAKRQARDAGHSYQAELRVLALHGLLHLLGYDHEHPDDRGRMSRVESRLRRKGGLKVGLIGRSRDALR